MNLAGITEPNWAIVIFYEVTPHFEYLNIMHFLHKVTHFQALFSAVIFISTF